VEPKEFIEQAASMPIEDEVVMAVSMAELKEHEEHVGRLLAAKDERISQLVAAALTAVYKVRVQTSAQVGSWLLVEQAVDQLEKVADQR